MTIAERQGEFPGMLADRSFEVVFVDANHGVGIVAEGKPDKVIRYSGKQITVTP